MAGGGGTLHAQNIGRTKNFQRLIIRVTMTKIRNTTICLALFMFLFQAAALAQTTYDFSTPASLDYGPGGFGIWYTEAVIQIDGVSYTLTSGGNGSLSNTTGGNGGSAALRKDGSGGDQFVLKRTDGEPFKFYSMWVKHQSMYPYSNVPPYYRITYKKVNGESETESENGQNTTRTHTKELAVKSVSIQFNALMSYWIDDIKVGPAVTITATTSHSNVACNGASTGAASVADVSGGTEPYSYEWTGSPEGDGTPAITGLTAGSYTCTITDAEGYSISKTIVITQPAALDATVTATRATAPGAHDGTATATITGGTAPYSYAWAPTGGTASSAAGLPAGTYTCTVTDANGCSIEKEVIITEPAVPTDIMLSVTSINERVPSGTVVGELSTVDPGDTHTYTLVSGTGDADNASFEITGDKLIIASVPDYETQNSYHIRIRTTDSDEMTYEKELTIVVNDVDEYPLFTALPSTTATVGAAYGYTIQATDPFDEALDFQLIGDYPSWLNLQIDKSGTRLSGTPAAGDIGEHQVVLRADNGVQYTDLEFTIGVSGFATLTNLDDLVKVYGDAAFTLEGPASTNPEGEFTFASSNPVVATIDGRSVTIKKPGTTTITVTQSASGYYYETSVTITLTVEKRSLLIVADDQSKIIGTPNPTLTYTISGFADGDDERVFVALPVISTMVNDETSVGDYDITVGGADADNYVISYEKGTFSVIAGKPSGLSLSLQPLLENQSAGTSAGTLTATSMDPNATFSYSLVAGAGDTDNDKFSISGDQLITTTELNYEGQALYSVRIRTTTQYGFWLEDTFTVELTDVNEVPTLEAVPDHVVCYTPEQQTVPLEGISSGEEGSAQLTSLSITTNNDALFEKLEIQGESIVYVLKQNTSGTGSLTVTVTDDGGKANGGADTFSRDFVLTVHALPEAEIATNGSTSVSKGTRLLLTASGGTAYHWEDSPGIVDGHSSSALSVRPSENTTYRVVVTDGNNCQASEAITIMVEEDYAGLNPVNNIMSPNGDGINDYLIIKNIDMYPNNTLRVFDRAGRVVYTKSGYNGEWDGTVQGTPLAEDTYYYVVDFGPGARAIKGFVTILR